MEVGGAVQSPSGDAVGLEKCDFLAWFNSATTLRLRSYGPMTHSSDPGVLVSSLLDIF